MNNTKYPFKTYIRILIGTKIIKLGILSIILFFSACSLGQKIEQKIPVKVLIVNFFETPNNQGERHLWLDQFNLKQELPFTMGNHSLYYNPDTQVLQMMTGQGNLNASVSMTALGLDPRFDFSHTYTFLAGIAGGDPQQVSLGSAVWSRYIVDGDLKHAIDPREMPKEWQHGEFPYNQKSMQGDVVLLGTEFFQINPSLLNWAYNLTKNIPIPDDIAIQKRRNLYTKTPQAMRPPFVMIGDNLTASEYWHGSKKTQWARNWIKYYTQGKGQFVTSAMEDTGIMAAITKLDAAGIIKKDRVLSLRTISNYSMEWPTATPYESFMGERDGFSGLGASVNAAYLVGSPVILEIINHWDKYKNNTPKV